MQKQVKFALIVCLVVLAVAAVLSLTYPEVQKSLSEASNNAGERMGEFFEGVGEAFRRAFIKDPV